MSAVLLGALARIAPTKDLHDGMHVAARAVAGGRTSPAQRWVAPPDRAQIGRRSGAHRASPDVHIQYLHTYLSASSKRFILTRRASSHPGMRRLFNLWRHDIRLHVKPQLISLTSQHYVRQPSTNYGILPVAGLWSLRPAPFFLTSVDHTTFRDFSPGIAPVSGAGAGMSP